MLRVEDVGLSLGNPDPVDADDGPPRTSLVGTWPGARVVPCVREPDEGEACVPGGAFWMGGSHGVSFDGLTDAYERLVTLSPFFIDETEVTVGAFRQGFPRPGEIYLPTPNSQAAQCNYAQTPSAFDPLPLVCLTRDNAIRYCHAHGKELPTEAHYEFVASGRGQGWTFPWGDDNPRCADAVFGMGGPNYDDTCGAQPAGPGMQPPGTGRLDRVALGDEHLVVDLAGNVAEIMRDAWSDPPRSPVAGVLTDPVLPAADEGDVVVRGGAFLVGITQLHATARDHYGYEYVSPTVGFRCVRPGA